MAGFLLLSFMLFFSSEGVLTTNDRRNATETPNFQDEYQWTVIPKNKTIIGGKEAHLGEIPYQVVLLREGRLYCGGSIINKCFVLTAAHCVTDDEDNSVSSANYFSIVAGIVDFEEPGETKEIEKIIRHEEYSLRNADIALLQLKEPLKFNRVVRSIPLLRGRYPAEGETGRVSGWGLDSDGNYHRYLQYVDLPLVNIAYCRDAYGGLPPNVLCAELENKDACRGDSGGPLAIQGELAGLVSFGKGCAQKGYPGVYTDVSAYIQWIEENTHGVRCSASYSPVRLNIIHVVILATLLFIT